MDIPKLLVKGAKQKQKRDQIIAKLDGGEEEFEARVSLQRISGVGGKTSKKLYDAGFESREDVANASVEELKQVDGVGDKRAKKLQTNATGCFIATAACGTAHAQEIYQLRDFRDDVLLQNTIGTLFVSCYYRFSPPIAEWISRSEWRQTLVRKAVIEPSLWFVRE